MCNVMKRYMVFTDIGVARGITRTFEVMATDIGDAWAKAKESDVVEHGDVTNVMLHFSQSPSRIHISEAIEVSHEGRCGEKTRLVCPGCASHEQGEPYDVHDCKVVFFDDAGDTQGQCCCYSREHGMRGD